MSRRASLPGASELFRRTSNPVFGDGAVTPAAPPAPASAPEAESVEATAADTAAPTAETPARAADEQAPAADSDAARKPAASEKPPSTTSGSAGLAKAGAGRRGSGRQKHDAKITVYLSGDELVAMEQARLALRASHDLAVDRGRIVREAVAVLLADFEARGEDSVLVTRLRDGDLDDQEAAN
ncbi:hypothetical protein FB384_004280 [Prauserella sediminis]|uniref:Cobyrinic acid a,c-diamide synthase n=1 Tax=Prauserella sediminis TaxID=577680 RepID=A0A839XRI8_9PSEU|nr:cobyrinic acid a,c-diamide synthase [Prauserella sediminis]MBB3665327.1 hypothetical protein [Prauserella sediminis]